MDDALTAIEILDYSVDQCDEIVSCLESATWDPSTTGKGSFNSTRTSLSSSFPFLSFKNPLVIHEMNRVVWAALDSYATRWGFAFSAVQDVSVQRYERGQKYDLHADAGLSYPNRVVSALVYLNTVAKGGETHFPHVGVSVTPVEGRIAIFPSNYVYAHEALPPVSGVKYAAAYWAVC